ncbi:LuxR C-terminal-related transcriptional regulator [Massilia sp. TSP1-1-2]|uniref:response regulator transcription factor n=1 Tax=unclassified Massilia TaxID=2609279 RepID=UPI003CF3847C
MRTDHLALTDHLFISPSGIMLPAWREAFSGARAIAIDQLDRAPAASAVLWLRLDGSFELAAMVGAVHQRCGLLPVVILSDTPNDAEALAALSAQARGYCNSHAGAPLLAKVASVVTQGGLWIGETLMHRILSVQHLIQVPAAAARPDWRERLTPREAQVAELAGAGMRYKEVARELAITERTVKAHMGAILEKLDLRDRLQLALLVGERQPS